MTLQKFPQHNIIVSPKLKKLLVLRNILFQREYFFEVTHSIELLLAFKKHQPVFRRQNIKTVLEIKTVKIVNISCVNLFTRIL